MPTKQILEFYATQSKGQLETFKLIVAVEATAESHIKEKSSLRKNEARQGTKKSQLFNRALTYFARSD